MGGVDMFVAHRQERREVIAVGNIFGSIGMQDRLSYAAVIEDVAFKNGIIYTICLLRGNRSKAIKAF
jgi:hypothetical protein